MTTKMSIVADLMQDIAVAEAEAVRRLGDAVWQLGEYRLWGGTDPKDLGVYRANLNEALNAVVREPRAVVVK